MTAYYFDASVFVTSVLANQAKSVTDACREWQLRAARGEIEAVTSTLTWDEVAWAIGRGSGAKPAFDHRRAASAGSVLLSLPNIAWIAVDRIAAVSANALLASRPFRPRDAVHASIALRESEGRIVTADHGFGARAREDPSLGLQVIDLTVP